MNMNKNFILPILFLSVLIFCSTAFCKGEAQENPVPEQPEKEVVATIDGDEVYMSELNQMINLQQAMIQIQQMNPQFVRFLYTSPEGQTFLDAFKKNQLQDLITRKLLEREAEREEVTLTDEDEQEYFQEQVDMIMQQNKMTEEDLMGALKQQGIESLDQFKQVFLEQQGESLRVHKLIEEVIVEKVNVTDEEAKEMYDQGQYQMEFDEVKDQIKRELAQQQYIDQLKDKANIEILL
jgi:peptidyl-prolyl cis-trans isomerase C/foldase protein PrsA